VPRVGVDFTRAGATSITDDAARSEDRYVILTDRTGSACSRMSERSRANVGAASETNDMAALWTSCGSGTTVAAIENSGSGTHIRIAIAATCRCGMTTDSSVPVEVQLLAVSRILMRPQKPLPAHFGRYAT
jgi:hypothetical protein